MKTRVSRIARLGGLALVVGLICLMAACGEPGDDAGTATVGDPEITGDALPGYVPSGPDSALGRPAPQVRGSDFDGRGVAIVDDGRMKVLVFLAHWCSHCQDEVPEVQAWVNSGGKPEGVDLYGVATAIDEGRSNYPPDAWLEREGWTPPVLVDTNDSVLRAFGLTSFPTWVFINADGTVALRIGGAIGQSQLTVLFKGLR